MAWRGSSSHASFGSRICQTTHRAPSVGSIHPQRSRGSDRLQPGASPARLIGWELRRIWCPWDSSWDAAIRRVTGRTPLIANSPSWCEANCSRGLDGHSPPAQDRARSPKPAPTDRTYSNAYDNYHGDSGQEYYKMFYLNFLASALTTDLRVGVSMGEWETVITLTLQTFPRFQAAWSSRLSVASICFFAAHVALTVRVSTP